MFVYVSLYPMISWTLFLLRFSLLLSNSVADYCLSLLQSSLWMHKCQFYCQRVLLLLSLMSNFLGLCCGWIQQTDNGIIQINIHQTRRKAIIGMALWAIKMMVAISDKKLINWTKIPSTFSHIHHTTNHMIFVMTLQHTWIWLVYRISICLVTGRFSM